MHLNKNLLQTTASQTWCAQELLGDLIKMPIPRPQHPPLGSLIKQVWHGAYAFAFLPSSWVMRKLLLHPLPFQQLCLKPTLLKLHCTLESLEILLKQNAISQMKIGLRFYIYNKPQVGQGCWLEWKDHGHSSAGPSASQRIALNAFFPPFENFGFAVTFS